MNEIPNNQLLVLRVYAKYVEGGFIVKSFDTVGSMLDD